MNYYSDPAHMPTYLLVLGSLSAILILMHFIGPALKAVTKIFCLPRYKVYRIYRLLKIVKWVLTIVIIIGWVLYG